MSLLLHYLLTTNFQPVAGNISMIRVQISAKRGPDSRFIVEANTKCPSKSSRSQIVNLMDRGRVTRPCYVKTSGNTKPS